MNRAKRGFTLIELIVVVIIVGILASVAIPVMQNMTKKAILSEAITALGVIRTAVRAYYIEHDTYPSDTWFGTGTISGITNTDLDGTYFSRESYYIRKMSDTAYRIGCWPYDSKNTKALKVCDPGKEITGTIYVDQDGNFRQKDISCSGFDSGDFFGP